MLANRLTERDLKTVQDRREKPTKRTQWLQVAIQNTVIKGALGSSAPLKPPFALKLLSWLPILTRIPTRVIGLGFQPEHVDTAVIP